MNVEDLISADAEIIATTVLDWEKLERKTFLISGATGYVSQFLIHAFMKRNNIFHSGIKVIALCRSKNKADLRFSQYYGRTDFEVLIQDICDEVRVEECIHYIIHAASPAGLVASNENPVETFKVNVFGADNLLSLAVKKKAEFLYFSSVDIYGKIGEKRFVESELGYLDTMDVRNVYAYAKRATENLAICYMKKGVTVKIVRPTQIMGGGIELSDGRLHIDFISQIKQRNKIVLKGDGSPVRSFIYMTDAIVGVLTVLIKGENGQAYNVCNEDAEATVLEFAEIMSSCTKETVEIEFNLETRENAEVKHAVSIVTACSDKLRNLGWYPKISISDACKKMMMYYGIEVKD